MSDNIIKFNKEPTPGSTAAILKGCTCPIIDNAHGRGYMGVAGMFVYREGCPVHAYAFETDEPFVVGSSATPSPTGE